MLLIKKLVAVLFVLFSTEVYSQNSRVKVIQFDSIEKLMSSESDTVYVLNFWATWCKPCVEELPYFDKITNENKGKKLKVLLICMDFKSKLNERVIPFVKKNKIASKVLLLNEPDYNSWIDKINPKWSGSIPATLVFKGSTGAKDFYEQSFNYIQLKKAIDKVINN